MEKINPRNQYLAGGIALCTVSLTIGTIGGFSAILLPQLEDEQMLIAKSDEGSWVASIANAAQVFASVLLGMLADYFGRRKTIVMASSVIIISWAVIGFSNGSYPVLIFGRVLQGIGILNSISQVYLAEIGDAKRRGILAGCGPLFVSTGVTMVYTLGALLPWRWVCLVCAVFPALTILLIKFMPETPTWLVEKGKMEDAKKTLVWLRGVNYNVDEELDALERAKNQAHGMMEKDHVKNEKHKIDLTKITKLYREMLKPEAYKPFIMLIVTFVLQQGCGSFAVIFYAVNVFQDAGVATSPYVAAIITGLIRQFGTLLGAILLSRYPRKILMSLSAFLMGVFMLGLGLTIKENLSLSNFNVQNSSSNSTDDILEEETTWRKILAILPIVEIIGYMLTFGMGVGTVPWLLLGELSPPQVKSFTSGMLGCVATLMIFVVVKIFPFMVLNLGPHGAYFVFCGICFTTCIYSFVFIPETRGKSMVEVQALYQKKTVGNDVKKDKSIFSILKKKHEIEEQNTKL